MADGFRVTTAILAAGRSRRFGKADKLRAPFRGKALGLHAAATLAKLASQHRIIITSRLHHMCASGWQDAGFSLVKNPNADEGMGTSVAVAARIARRSQSDALLIALADMPLVPFAHFRALTEAAKERGNRAVIASHDGEARMPPALFGSAHFDALAQLSGDQGARALLANAEPVACSPELLVDIDTPEALAALR